MRLTTKLVRVAALVAAAAAGAAACSSSSSADCSANPSGCGCFTSATITAAQACQMLREAGLANFSYAATGPTCRQVCPNQPSCSLPVSYITRAQALNPDASAAPGDGGLAVSCPTGPATMTVTCGVGCG